ncbi:MAG TPA: hypothetical protein VHC72_06185 [Bryobacteraceae bacterium]|nr:hypothetical protein [Bryobacteraceae bacterium]
MKLALFSCAILAASLCQASPRIDNVLIRMVPPGTDGLVGAHMDQIIASPLYQKLVAQQKLPQLDQFARETGFDPRRDVREILSAATDNGTVLLARGIFHVKDEPIEGLKLVRHGEYNIHVIEQSGFCILDSTLAVAGQIPAVEAALDEWKANGSHHAADQLLKGVGSLNPQTPLWGVSTGFAQFLAQNLPGAGNNGIDFRSIFKGIQSTWFSAELSTGFDGGIHCTTANEKDAMNLRDAAKGLIGLGRLSVPENRPELLKFWDGFNVEQSGRSFALNIDVSVDLIDQMVQMLSAPSGRGSGGRGASGSRSRI